MKEKVGMRVAGSTVQEMERRWVWAAAGGVPEGTPVLHTRGSTRTAAISSPSRWRRRRIPAARARSSLVTALIALSCCAAGMAARKCSRER
jgi:hypothetical protein